MIESFTNEITGFWAEWSRPSAGLPIVLWSLLLAVAAASGHLVQRYMGLPKVVGYSIVGTVVGFAGFEGALWPLQGIGLFLLELGVAIVLFEAGGRLPLRWFRYNPSVLLQSLLEATLTYFAVFWVLHWIGIPDPVANPIALMAIVASPAVLSRVVMDTRASGRSQSVHSRWPRSTRSTRWRWATRRLGSSSAHRKVSFTSCTRWAWCWACRSWSVR